MIILTFTLIQLLVAVANLWFIQSYSQKPPPENERVSVLIPARNEENTISNLLTDLQKQEYRNIEIIVFNDQSTDKTGNILQKFAEEDHLIRCIHSTELPNGWLGKNYACHSLSGLATGNYFLFLDADVRIGKKIIGNTLASMKKYNLGLLSIFPVQIMKTFGEKVTVPNMNYILLSLLPLILVRKSGLPSLTAANGQFMFFKAASYKKIQPHKAVKHHKVEDIEIARLFKRNLEPIACHTGNHEITCRMYSGFKEAVNGFSKNVIMFFGNSFLLAILFWLVTTMGVIVIYFYFPLQVFILYLAAIILIRIVISMVSRQKVLLNLLLAVPQQVTLGIFIFSAFVNKFNKQYKWKGRNIS